MATEEETAEGVAPPAGERVHLPGPSFLPIVLALGASIAIVGIVISPIFLVIGAVLFLVALVPWIREAREEMSELPLER